MSNEKEITSLLSSCDIQLKVLINEVIILTDKNGKDYWIIKTNSGKDYFAFSADWHLTHQTLYILVNCSEMLKGRWATLTIRERKGREKVISIQLEK